MIFLTKMPFINEDESDGQTAELQNHSYSNEIFITINWLLQSIMDSGMQCLQNSVLQWGGVLHSDARNFEENWNMEHGVCLTLFMEWITPLLAPTSVSTTSAWTPPPSTWSARSWLMCQQCGHCGWHDGQHSQCGPRSTWSTRPRSQNGQHGQDSHQIVPLVNCL